MTNVRALARLLRRAQTKSPEDVIGNLAEGASIISGRDLVLYLIDYEQQSLQPTPEVLSSGEPVPPASVVGTMVGRCFATQALLEAPSEQGISLWVPVSERAERLGVLTLVVDELDDDGRELAEELGLLAALLVLAASSYCDRFHLQRRRVDLNLLNGDVMSVAVFDAMGHGLPSSIISGLAVGAYRHARRTGVPLDELFSTMDHAVAGLMGDTFATALAAELDITTGTLAWVSAGHPAPIVVRDGSVLAGVEHQPALPLGLRMIDQQDAVAPAQLALQPGDHVLLYTDGVVEARSPDGEEFGLTRLMDLFVRESGSGLLASEVLRRLVHACLEFQGGRLRDDATLLLLEWAGPSSMCGRTTSNRSTPCGRRSRSRPEGSTLGRR